MTKSPVLRTWAKHGRSERAESSVRSRLRLALQELHAAAPVPVDRIALPASAPIRRVVVDVAGCTLCLACVGAC